MKNKKGFLLGEETVKIVISLIVLVFLVILLFKLYNGVQDNKLEQAKSSLNYLIEQINAEGVEEVVIYNPEGWWITVWHDPNPDLCSKWDSCLCICDGNSIGDCDKKGVCKGFNLDFDEVQIDPSNPISLTGNLVI